MKLPTAPLSIGLRVGLAVALLLSSFVVLPQEAAVSRERDRTLKLHFGHTGERGSFTYKRNGRYDRKELARINEFLRDWRKKESTRMDPQLLDLVWEIYQEARASDYVHVVSAYRSPTTNESLRRRSKGVAKNSQHTRGKAMDFAIPGVPLDKLRAIAMKKQGGGVGYYPRSGFPFVHVDTGSVRAWPRMSRQQLLALFPNGETLHLPPDGKPLQGYQRALARRESTGTTTVAYLETDDEGPQETDRTGTGEGRGVGSWLKRVFPGGKGADETETAMLSDEPRQPVAETDDELQPRMPRARPGSEIQVAAVGPEPRPAQVAPSDARMMATLAFAPLPRTRPDPVFLASSLGEDRSGTAPLPLGGDAIAALVAGSQGGTPANDRTGDDDPVALAFAALDGHDELPSEDDRAAIAAFAVLRAEAAGASQPSFAMLRVGPRPVAVVTAAQAAPLATSAGEAAPGVVLGPGGVPSYRADQDAMRSLIATPAAYEPQIPPVRMPVLAHSGTVYDAPKRGDDPATGLNGTPALPTDRFETAETQPEQSPESDEQGFFMRLFASLIE